mmetsp:Transcript_18075/g.28806  ORF Transcript_18075/g.28806 Transcript_18075/m.28806 type:complete len:184 (+) Transcript_18075:518-1069(+)
MDRVMSVQDLVVGSPYSRDVSPLRKRLFKATVNNDLMMSSSAEHRTRIGCRSRFRSSAPCGDSAINRFISLTCSTASNRTSTVKDMNYCRLKYKLFRSLNVVKDEIHHRRSNPIPIPTELKSSFAGGDTAKSCGDKFTPIERSEDSINDFQPVAKKTILHESRDECSVSLKGEAEDTQFALEI